MIAAVILLLLAGGGYFAYTNYFQTARAGGRRGNAAANCRLPSLTTPDAAEEIGARNGRRVSRDQADARGACWPRARNSPRRASWPPPSWCGAAPPRPATRRPSSSSRSSTIRWRRRPRRGFTPDGARAADWYERAALAGNAEAQRKLGLLLAKGGAGLPADPAKAKTWLQQAAAQNDADAKKALDALPK